MTERKRVLTLTRNRRNLELLSLYLRDEGLGTVPVTSLEEMDRILAETNNLGLALLDISGFDSSVWSRCQALRDKGIPLLVIAPRQSMAIQQQSHAAGAHGVFVKPLIIRELLALIRTLLEGL